MQPSCPGVSTSRRFLRVLIGMHPVARRAAVELICVGRLSKEKEPALAVDVAFELHRRGLDVHLTMVGAGPMQGRLEHRARDLPVTFTGHVHDRRDVARLHGGRGRDPCRHVGGKPSASSSWSRWLAGHRSSRPAPGPRSRCPAPEAGMAAPSEQWADGRCRVPPFSVATGRISVSRPGPGPSASRGPRAAESILALHLGDRERARCA